MILLFLGLFIGLTQGAHAQVLAFENAAARDIASKLHGGACQVRVHADVGPEAIFGDVHSVRIEASHFETDGLPLYTESKRSHRGLVRMLHLGLQDFTIRDLHMQRLTADIPGCRFDFALAMSHRKIRLSQSGVGEGQVEIGEKDLEKFILSKYPEVKRVSVTIDKDKIIVEGFGEFLIVRTDFYVVARLESPGGNQLVLARARILLDGKPADEESQKAILDALNPVVNLDQDLGLFGAIKVQHIVLRGGVLKASGPVVIPEQPK